MQCEIIVGGSSYTVDVQADDGLGMAPLHRLSSRGPMQHGASDQGFRLDPRVFSLALTLKGHGPTLSELYDLRGELLDWLAPGVDMKLLFTLDNGTERQIDCHAIDAPMGHDVTSVWAAQVVAVRFMAPDPTFYDPAGMSVRFGLSGGGGSLQVPLEVPTEVGASDLDQTTSISYSGNFRSLPWRIRIIGPITNPVITNLATDEKLDFTGYTIAAGDYYDIDCRYGHKTVEDSSGTNKVAELSDDSDLATFHLTANNAGVNDISIVGTSVDGDTEVYLNYYERYLGI